MTYCLNCGTSVTGKFCHECGQKIHVPRLTAKALMDEIIHFFTHLEHTFFQTTLHFIVKPGITSLNYINGKRKRYQKPVSFFLIWTGVYILLHNLIINKFDYELVLKTTNSTLSQAEANAFFRNHFSFFMLPLMTASAIIIWLVLGRHRFYFFELFTIVLYGGGTYFGLCIVSDIILGVIFRVNINHYNVFLWQTILSGIYNTWFTFDFFSNAKIKWLWPRLIITSVLIAFIGNQVMLYLPLAWLSIMK